MKLTVGYQQRPDSRFINAIISHADRVSEVYFAWPGVANGRSTVAKKLDISAWYALNRQIDELKRVKRNGINLNMLLNGNCYGDRSLSRAFYIELGEIIDSVGQDVGLDSVTTASPVIARFVKQNFEGLSVRASVNMEIGTTRGVEYLSDCFDGFYAKREINRDIKRLKVFSDFCRSMGKGVYILANSGCLNDCSARQFHDNLVSHELGVMAMDNAYEFNGVCRKFLSGKDGKERILELSNWIRPEDLDKYDGLADCAKLATRVSETPEMILNAYATGKFSGNLLSLTEPDFSALYRPYMLASGEMPRDFFERTTNCGHDCATCSYCRDAYRRAAVKIDEDILM